VCSLALAEGRRKQPSAAAPAVALGSKPSAP